MNSSPQGRQRASSQRADRKPPPPGLGARNAALRILDAVLRRGEALETTLPAATRHIDDRADKALAHAIAAETLRHLTDLDALIDSATATILPDDAKARMVLRMALAQALVLKTPHHAVIATALPLIDGGPRRLVHGVLGALLRAEAPLPDPPSLPAAVNARWTAHWGEAISAAARRALTLRAPIDLALKDASDTAAWTDRLKGISLAPGHVRLSESADIPSLSGYDEGAWWVQDLAASIPGRLLGPGDGRHVLDLCAAPGGKTMQLAVSGWRVTSLDIFRATA